MTDYTHKLDPRYTPLDKMPKFLNVLVITDGEPSAFIICCSALNLIVNVADKKDLIACIVKTTKRLEKVDRYKRHVSIWIIILSLQARR